MGLEPVPHLDSREVEQVPLAHVEKVDARKNTKKKSKRRRRKKKKATESSVPRLVGGPVGYMSEVGIQKVHERRRRHGLSMDQNVSVSEFLEATEWRIPREMVHRSKIPLELARRPGRRRPAAMNDNEKKKKATRGTPRSAFLRQESAAISDITTFESSHTAAPLRPKTSEDQRPIVLDPIETNSGARKPLVLSSIAIETDEDSRCVANKDAGDLARHLHYTREEDRVQRTYRRVKGERPKSLKRKPHRVLTKDRIEKAQIRDRKRIEKAATRARSKDDDRVRARTRQISRNKKPTDIWDLLQDEAIYNASFTGLPPPPSIMSTRQSSDFEDSRETTKSSERHEHIRQVTKADKALLDRLLSQESQPPPLEYI